MPRIISFNNRQIVEPGTYGKMVAGTLSPAVLGTYGNVMIIDTGSGTGYGFGAGINGELENNANAIYEFPTLEDSKKAFKGGLLWDLMDYLWSPSNAGGGVNKLFYARAATTVAAKVTMNFTSQAKLVIAAKSEGTVGNGATLSGVLTKGFSVKLKAGVVDAAKFIMTFYQGQYKGQDIYNNNDEYDVAESSVKDTIICQSTEFSNIGELVTWMNADYQYNLNFKNTTVGLISGATNTLSQALALDLNSTDITNYGSHTLFAGGTCVYSSTDLDTLLSNIDELDNSLFLCDDFSIVGTLTNQQQQDGVNKGAQSVQNTKILSYIKNVASYTEKIMFVGGGNTANQFTGTGSSVDTAKYFNTENVVVVHSGVKVNSRTSTSGLGYKFLPSLYHAAMVCGRTAGLEPQVPVTYKSIRILGLQHELKKSQRETALLSGVLHARNVPQLGWVVNQAINSTQLNGNLILPDGSSPEISITRIKHQLNKELIINSTPRFIGGNLNTSSAEDIKLFTESYLFSRTATRTGDSLIMRFEKVQVTLDQDVWNVRYCFVPNGPINRIFYTGVILDAKISI